MILLFNPSTDPARNLAFEEYLLTRRTEDFIIVWRNRPSIIVGRNQNPSAEINHEYVQRNHIPVLRRNTGGGAVYHDVGNINFSLIRSFPHHPRIDYQECLEPVIEFLNHIGADTRLEGRSDIVVDGGKISGNAQHLHKNRVLHHGTILFDTDLAALSHALSPGPGRYIDRATESIRKDVTNIRPLLETDLTPEAFMHRFLTFFQAKNADALQSAITMAEQGIIDDIAEQKYNSWEWNFGRSPDYRFENTIETPNDRLSVQLSVSKSIIQNARFEGKRLTAQKAGELAAALTGQRHTHTDVAAALDRIFLTDTAGGVSYRSVAAGLL